VTFLHERLPDNYLSINAEVYFNRKQIADKRWKAMKNLLLTNVCRAKYLISYFGQETDECGKCDYCRSKINSNYSFSEILAIINENLIGEMSLNEIISKIDLIKESEIMKGLNYLLLEEKILLKGGLYVKK
jgi:ATP-dependent DNA helicase RecQ